MGRLFVLRNLSRHGTKCVPVSVGRGVVLRFELGKGSYATSFLSHAFRLYEGLPIPAWVQDGEVDGLAVIGDGTIAPFKERFKEILVKRDPNREKEKEEE